MSEAAARQPPARIGGNDDLEAVQPPDPVHAELMAIVVGLPAVAEALSRTNLVAVVDDAPTPADAIDWLAGTQNPRHALIVADTPDAAEAVWNARTRGVTTIVVVSSGNGTPPAPPRVIAPATLNDILGQLSALNGWPRLHSDDGWDTLIAGPPPAAAPISWTPPPAAPVPAPPPAQAPLAPTPQPGPAEMPPDIAAALQEIRATEARLNAWEQDLQARELATRQNPAAQPAPQPAAPAVDWQPDRAVRRNGEVFVTLSKAGGVGKTVTTLGIGDYLARSLPARRIAVIDANIEQGDFRTFLEHHMAGRAMSSLEELRLDPQLTVDAPTTVMRHMAVLDSGLHVLFAPPAQAGNPALLTPAFMNMVTRALRPHFDWILVDTQSAEWHDELFREFVLPNADRLLVVINPSIKSVRNNKELMAQLQIPRHQGGANIDPARISVILNRNDTPGCLSFDEIEQMMNWPYILGVIPERAGNLDVVAIADRHLKAALGILCSRLTGDPDLAPKTTAGRRLVAARLRKLVERGGGR